MKDFDNIPVWHFITLRYLTPPVQKIVETWRVEPQQVIEKLNEHFRELGVFTVPHGQERLIMHSILHQLKTSPEILKMLVRNRQDELRRQRSRHAD